MSSSSRTSIIYELMMFRPRSKTHFSPFAGIPNTAAAADGLNFRLPLTQTSQRLIVQNKSPAKPNFSSMKEKNSMPELSLKSVWSLDKNVIINIWSNCNIIDFSHALDVNNVLGSINWKSGWKTLHFWQKVYFKLLDNIYPPSSKNYVNFVKLRTKLCFIHFIRYIPFV